MVKQPPPPPLWLTCLLLLQTYWFSFSACKSSIPRWNNLTDQAALLTFRSFVTWEPNKTLSNNWTTDTSFCNWIGVSCSHSRRRVTKLDLHDMGLEGTIPPHIGDLSFLAHLSISKNNFHGHLPHELGQLCRLKVLDLYENRIEGRIPSSFANLSKLHLILLSSNSMQGNIPADLGRLLYLKTLDVSNNSLSGEIPRAIFNISSLVQLSLSYNNFSGQLPMDTGNFLPNLERLEIYENQMSGLIPISLSNASNLVNLWLSKNYLSGGIHDSLGHLLHLKGLRMEVNNLTGTIPSSIFNMSNLLVLALGNNSFSGHLPLDMGNWLPNISGLYLWSNRLSGEIPLSLGNASKLSEIEISDNKFSGPFPTTLGKLSLLQWLSVSYNQLVNVPGTKELNFLAYFASCRFLEAFNIEYNPIRGILPSSIGNLSTLQVFRANKCQIEGTIPTEIGNLSSLISLLLAENNLRGAIPSTIGGLKSLQGLSLRVNMLEGSIPTELSALQYLSELYLGSNMLSGDIPDLFKNISRLQIIYLSNNKLSGIPSSLWSLQDLLELYLSHNLLRGDLPQEVGILTNLIMVDFSENQFTGLIPNSWGHLQMLQTLDLRSNSLEGPIPQSFGKLISIEFMDMSSNHLNGTIPKSLEMLQDLKDLNLSFNNLEGEIPNGGVFANITSQSFIGNFKLCRAPKLHINLNVSICRTNATNSRDDSLLRKIIIPIIVVTTFVVCFSLFVIYRGKKNTTPSSIENLPITTHKMISYQELLHATNNFNEANLIGVGSFGSVYKGTMVDGTFVAVKVLNIQSTGAWESFDAECKAMRNARHRNLVKIITSCSNLDFRALVLQFMSKGSLDQWLYSHNNYLGFLQRIMIMLDVALAMEYLHHHYSGPTESLHHHYSGPIIHCDLKPSNILLDEDMVAHVSDFGIAKLLDMNKSSTRTKTLGTIGYIAPEYGSAGKVSTKGDVYSYGILLLEILTRKKPTDSMFTGGLSLRQWVDEAFPHAIHDVVDMNLMREINSSENNGEEVGDPLACLVSIAEVALLCSRELAEERIDMKEVVLRLMKIKELSSI